MILILASLGAFASGFAIAYFWSRSRQAVLETQLENEINQAQEKIKLIEAARSTLENSFKSLSSDALQKNNEAFLLLAKTQFENFQALAKNELDKKQDGIVDLVKPVRESLEKVDLKLQNIEKNRIQTEQSLKEQMRSLTETHQNLRTETSSLVAALRSPQTRGQWGEMQLKRVIEMAGMLDHCDFLTQASVTDDQQNRLRPDVIVSLPGGKNIVVDAKTPLNAYMDAMQAESPDLKKQKFMDHARHIRKHIDDLSKKAYWNQFQPSPDFVVLFLPGESFFSAALEQDPALIEVGITQNVIIATPTTLISLLRAASYGWQQERLAENIREIAQMGQELYKRLSDMTEHFNRIGKNLGQTVQAYNDTLGSLERRVLVTARKFQDQKILGQINSLPELANIEQTPKELQIPELN